MTDPQPPKRTNATALHRGARKLQGYAATKPHFPIQGNGVSHQAESPVWPDSRRPQPDASRGTLRQGTGRNASLQSWPAYPQTNRTTTMFTCVDVRKSCVSSMNVNRVPLLVLTSEHDNSPLVLPFKNGGCYLGNANLMLGFEAESDRIRFMPSRNTKYIRYHTKAYRERLVNRLREGLLSWFQCGICGAMRLDPAGWIGKRRPICFDCQAVADRIAQAKEGRNNGRL